FESGKARRNALKLSRTTSRSTMRQGPLGRRVARKSRMRCVAMEVSPAALARRQAHARGPAGHACMRSNKVRDASSPDPAGGDTGTVGCRLAAMDFRPPGRMSALSALAWMGNPNRTAGNEGVPLQQPRSMDDRQTPERPAPSLLQDVLDDAAGHLTDRVRYSPGTVPITSPFRGSGDAHRHVRLWA